MSSPSAKHTPGLRCAVRTCYAPTHYSSEGGACPARACHPLPEGMGAHARQTCESLTEYCGFRYLVMNAPTFAFWVRGAQCTLPTATHACGGTRRLSPPGCEVIEVIESVRVLCADMRCSVAAKPAVPDGVHSPCRGVLYRRHLHLLPVTHHTRWHAGQRRPHAHGLRLLQCIPLPAPSQTALHEELPSPHLPSLRYHATFCYSDIATISNFVGSYAVCSMSTTQSRCNMLSHSFTLDHRKLTILP